MILTRYLGNLFTTESKETLVVAHGIASIPQAMYSNRNQTKRICCYDTASPFVQLLKIQGCTRLTIHAVIDTITMKFTRYCSDATVPYNEKRIHFPDFHFFTFQPNGRD